MSAQNPRMRIGQLTQLKQFKQLKQIRQIGHVWTGLAPRERFAVATLGTVVGCALVWVLVAAPILSWSAEAQRRYLRSESDLAWMRANAPRVKAPDEARTAPQLDSQGLLSQVAITAREAGLTLSRFQPAGNGEVTVELQRQDFNRILRWLRELRERQGVVVSSLSLTREQRSGSVSGRIRLRV